MDDPKDSDALIREKYDGDKDALGVAEDLARLRQGEPLAYVIGNVPFLGTTISLQSRPLIPRPETEWWTEELAEHIGTHAVSVLDLCAGSGAIGIALLKHCPNARVSFGERVQRHAKTIEENLLANGIEASRARIGIGDLFAPFVRERFDIIATNPPYIPSGRELEAGVTDFEPHEALYAETDGLSVIRRIITEAKAHLTDTGELWLECDIDNVATARDLCMEAGYSSAEIRTDQYGRERIVVAHL